ncbi:MAG: septal ring lytic transglycosylase RlpA family protein [Thalassotalea sp.]
MLKNLSALFFVITLFSGCAPTGRYQQHKDSVPSRTPTPLELKDIIPRAESKSRGGNKDYTVRGKFYQVLDSAKNFKEKGIASFYGEKFHGHLTSNGEIYNMYSMSAAHKNLPLPTYVKVTNLSNQRSAIVRVNDRGPFHPGRIIDLSYAAAYKLGITGTAPVEIESITNFTPKENNPSQVTTPVPLVRPLNPSSIPLDGNKPQPIIENVKNTKSAENIQQPYIQILATSNKENADKLVQSLQKLHQKPALSVFDKGLYKVLMGPFVSTSERFLMLQTLKRSGYENAFSKEMFLP